MLRAVLARLRRAPWWHGFACGLAFSSVARDALADDGAQPPVVAAAAPPLGAPSERVHIDYALGADCPAPDAFEHELDARLGTTWKAAPDELARHFTIAETPSGETRSVRMDYEDDAGRTIARSVKAPTCAEALSMMAVITAVAIEAQERNAAPKIAEARETTPPPRAKTPPAARPSLPTIEDTEVARPLSLVQEAGLRLGVAAGFGPRAALGVGAEWALVVGESLEVRAAIEGRTTGDVPAADGRAEFSAVDARGDVCVATWHLTAWLGLPVCAGLEVGVFWASGVVAPPAVASSRTSDVPWIAALVTPRIRLSSLRAYLELVPEIRAPFAGHTFLFEAPERTAYTTPGIAFGASLGAGVRFH